MEIIPFTLPEGFEERFWAKVEKTEGCWLWAGSKIKRGYGQIWDGTKNILAHRASWVMENGPIPEGMYMLHRCDVPACVRPSHLFVGTAADNTQDALSKGRPVSQLRPEAKARGEAHGNSKLSTTQVLEIRHLFAEGNISKKALSRRYDISVPVIRGILNRKGWSHV